MKIVIMTVLLAIAVVASAQGGIERLYVPACGVNQAKDQSRWSSGVNEGRPIEFSDNCSLIRHVAVSHTHGDDVGNVPLFPTSTILIQGAEYEWAMTQSTKPAFAAAQKFDKLSGDATCSATAA